MRVGSLFSGIGGLDLGLERAGMSVVWQCEADPYCRAVLRKHWPDVPCYDDVRAIGADLPAVDVLCGGFPCQPVSKAGKRKAQADDRWLWPEFARLIRDLRPRYALMENVPGLLTAAGGDAMGEVLGDLAAVGFDAEWESIPAAAVGAPHLRDRVFILAYPHPDGAGRVAEREARSILHPRESEPGRESLSLRGALADATSPREQDEPQVTDGQALVGAESRAGRRARGGGAPTGVHQRGRAEPDGTEVLADTESQRSELRPAPRERPWRPASGSPVDDPDCGRHGAPQGEVRAGRECSELPGWWATEPDVGRVAHGVPARVDRLRALGNAVVPQVAEWIGRQIMSREDA